MDLNQLRANAEQETAKQYFANPPGNTVSAVSIGTLLKYLWVGALFALLCVGSYQISKNIKTYINEEPQEFRSEVLKMSASASSFESEQALINGIQALPATAAMQTEQDELLDQVHTHNQHYQISGDPQLVLPASNQVEYPSLALAEGKILPRPKVLGKIGPQRNTVVSSTPLPVSPPASSSASVDREAAAFEESALSIRRAEPESGQFNIQFNNAAKLSQQIAKARALYVRGKTEQAIAQLQLLLSAHRQEWTVNKALLHILLKERRWQDGEVLVNKIQKPNRKRLAKAQLLQAKGELNEALIALRNGVPPIDEMPEYHQTLATLAQRMENFSEAEKIYKRLLLIDNDNGAYWLGLASAQDAMGNSKAVNSYWRARQFNAEHRAALKYINLRIKALSQASKAEALASREGASAI
ncbi:tetratricopeptide repeat protein [Pseudoteredinibacter isoporae]|uniref:tetratricopeptide repeat protein n=1 Tax=Pseudoteredinibacter isoporae TaxID=570281 RepID=UPI003102A9AD